jgi:hypothetical protein
MSSERDSFAKGIFPLSQREFLSFKGLSQPASNGHFLPFGKGYFHLYKSDEAVHVGDEAVHGHGL